MHLQVGTYIAPHQVSHGVASSHRIVQGARDINLSDCTAPIQHKAMNSPGGLLLEKSHNSTVGINPIGLSVCAREIDRGEHSILQQKAVNPFSVGVVSHDLPFRINPHSTGHELGIGRGEVISLECSVA